MNTVEQIRQFVACVYELDDVVEWRAIGGGRVEQGWVLAKDLDGQTDLLTRHNAVGLNIYVGVNPRRAKGLTTDANVTTFRTVFVDFDHLDAGDGISHTDIALSRIDDAKLPTPTLVVFSGHGAHCYWRLAAPIEETRWRNLQERLIQALHTDKTIKNPERIMRLPGFANVKAEPVDCFIVHADETVRYDLSAIEVHLPQVEQAKPTAALTTPRPDGYTERKARAVLYGLKWPACGEGERNASAFRHAAQMLRDFNLSDADAWEIVATWNAMNQPPLEDRELRQAFEDAKKYGKGTVGSKAESRPSQRRAALPDTAPTDPAAEAGRLLEAQIDGTFTNVDWPWPVLTDLGQCLTPGTRTLFVGGIGASKSLALLQAACFWVESGIRVAVLELERKRDFHLMRVLAQRTGIADLTKPKWVHENAEQARALYAEHREFLNRVGAAIHTPARQVTTFEAAEWVERMCRAGVRLVALDPVTILRREGDFWTEDDAFMDRIGRAVDATGASIVCVSHGKKGFNNTPDLDSLAGGAAWARFADSAIWLQSHDLKVSPVKTCLGTDEVAHDRTIHLLKTRSGEGTGVRLAYRFETGRDPLDRGALTLRELGILVRK